MVFLSFQISFGFTGTEQRIVIKHCVPVGMTQMDAHMFVCLFTWFD